MDDLTKFIIRQAQIEYTVIKQIAKRVNQILRMTPSDLHKLQQLYMYGADVRFINKQLARLTGLQVQTIKSMIRAEAQTSYESTKAYYDYRKKPFIKFKDNEPLQRVVEAVGNQTAHTYENLSNTSATGFYFRDPLSPHKPQFVSTPNTYKRVIDTAIQTVATGTDSYSNMLEKTLTDLGKNGMNTVGYNGRYQRLDTATRRNLLDGIRQVNQEVQRITGEQFNADGVEISVHSMSAPDHEPIQGHQFTNDMFYRCQNQMDFIDTNGIVFNYIDRPIGQWNCHHFAWSIVIGVNKPNFDLYELEAFKEANAKGYTFTNGKGKKQHLSLYECTQKQRGFELDIRKAKEIRQALRDAGLKEQAELWTAKIVALNQSYQAFCDGCGLKPRFDRTRIYT